MLDQLYWVAASSRLVFIGMGMVGFQCFFDDRAQQSAPDLVALAVQVQLVGEEQFGLRQALAIQKRRGGVEVVQSAVLAAELPDHRIRFAHHGPQRPAAPAGLDADKDNPGLGQLRMDQPGECPVVLENLPGALARRDVVVAGVKDDHPRFVWQHNPPGVVIDVGDLRAAEPAIDHRQFRETFTGRPQPDARTAHKQNGVGRE